MGDKHGSGHPVASGHGGAGVQLWGKLAPRASLQVLTSSGKDRSLRQRSRGDLSLGDPHSKGTKTRVRPRTHQLDARTRHEDGGQSVKEVEPPHRHTCCPSC